jgi:hypothetical protein
MTYNPCAAGGRKVVRGRALGANLLVRKPEARFAGFRCERLAGRRLRAATIDGRDCWTRGAKTGKRAWGAAVSSDRTAWRARKTRGFDVRRVDSLGRDS